MKITASLVLAGVLLAGCSNSSSSGYQSDFSSDTGSSESFETEIVNCAEPSLLVDGSPADIYCLDGTVNPKAQSALNSIAPAVMGLNSAPSQYDLGVALCEDFNDIGISGVMKAYEWMYERYDYENALLSDPATIREKLQNGLCDMSESGWSDDEGAVEEETSYTYVYDLQIPDFRGYSMADVEYWLRDNYIQPSFVDFNTAFGYEYDINCQLNNWGIVLKQSPYAGSVIQVSPSDPYNELSISNQIYEPFTLRLDVDC